MQFTPPKLIREFAETIQLRYVQPFCGNDRAKAEELKEFFPKITKKIWTTCVSSESSITKTLKKSGIPFPINIRKSEYAFEDRLNGIETITNELILKQLNIKFDYVYGGHCGSPLTAWTCEHVIFPVVYDGLEWLEVVERNPCNCPTSHKGGE